jgi:Carboxypeptidase regulatory-like domain
MKDKQILFSIILAAGLAVPYTAGQSVSARLDGVLTDSSKAVIARAEVTAQSQETGANTKAITNESGEYIFANLAPGKYTITAVFEGFKKAEVKDLVLQIGDEEARSYSDSRRGYGKRRGGFGSSDGGYFDHSSRRRGGESPGCGFAAERPRSDDVVLFAGGDESTRPAGELAADRRSRRLASGNQ